MQQRIVLNEVKRSRTWQPLLLLAIGLVSVMVFAMGIGSVAIAPAEVIRAIWHGINGELSGTHDTIIWKIRLPRVLLAALVGSALAFSGVAYQGIFRNPLADPYLLGVASGASFGAALAILVSASVPFLFWLSVPLSAFLFALLAVILVVFLARQGNTIPTASLILAGAVLGSSFTAATSFLMLIYREQTANVLAWLLGSFALSSWSKILSVLPFMIIALLVIILASRGLNLLQLGDEAAAQLGLPVEGFKYGLIVLATLATAAAVSVSGIIGFVGLIVPHAARLAFGPDHRQLIPISTLLGALFMVLADLLARSLLAPSEVPIGVITALVGGPFFLYLLRRVRIGS